MVLGLQIGLAFFPKVFIFKFHVSSHDLIFASLWLLSLITLLLPGLRIAPPEAPVTGYMFGKGVYFADMFSKSANYCYASNAATTGVLLLCEVVIKLTIYRLLFF